MDKKKLHINEAGHKSYPEPDVPVQAAWENMQQLLLQAPAAPAQASGFRKWLGKGMGKLLVGAGMAATISIITFVALQKKGPLPVTPTTPVTHTTHRTAARQPAAAKDTLSPVVQEKRVTVEFNNTPLKKMAVYIEKEFNVKVVLKGNIGNITLTTRFDDVTLQSLLDVMAVTLDCRYKLDKGNRLVTITGNGGN